MTKSDRPHHLRRDFLLQLAIFFSLALCGSLIAFTAAIIYLATFLGSPPFGMSDFDASLNGLEGTFRLWAGLSVGGVIAAAVSAVMDWHRRRSIAAVTPRGTLTAAASGPASVLPIGLILMINLLWYDVLLSVSLTIAATAVFFAVFRLFDRLPARTRARLATARAEPTRRT